MPEATSPKITKPDQSIVGTSSSENIGTTNPNITANNNNNDGDDMLLVTEFPPPPYYYTLASSNQLTPPEIPHRAFRVAAKRVRREKERARLESEKIRLEAEKNNGSSVSGGGGGDNDNGSGKGGDEEKSSLDDVVMTDTQQQQQQQQQDIDDDDSITDPIVAVFGEIVEDPTLVYVEEECNNPKLLRDNVKRLNRSVLQGFLKLVTKLVNDPIDNKKSRDELSHNIFVMLQECNKFREHQAREILIETLERQLGRREEGLRLLREQIRVAEEALAGMECVSK